MPCFQPVREMSATIDRRCIGESKMARRFGYDFEFAELYPDNRFPENHLVALQQRLGVIMPTIDHSQIKDLRRFVFLWCKHNLLPIPADADVSYETWRNGLEFNENRKKQLDEANECLNKYGLRTRDFNIKSFIKVESYPEFKYPRLINSRSDVFKCFFGPYAKLMESIVYQDVHFIKHVPVIDRPNYIMEKLYGPDRKYVYTDYSKFERHFVPEIMQALELQLYKHLLRNFPEVYHVVEHVFTGVNHMWSSSLTAQIQGCRMSGEVTTSLGNGFSNLMLFLFVAQRCGYRDVYNLPGVVEGDDGLFALSGPIPTKQQFAALGFDIKLGFVDNIGDASFCGLLFDSDARQIIREPMRFLCKFVSFDSASKCGNDKTMLRLLRAKLLSAACETPNCPIIWALLQATEKNTRHIQPKFDEKDWYFNINRPDIYGEHNIHLIGPPAPATRELFAENYGICVEDQIQLEKYLLNVKLGTNLCNNKLFYEIFKFDNFHKQFYRQIYLS